MAYGTTVSFIVPSYNSCSTIGATLESIRQQSVWDRVKEVIVVDSSEDGETRPLLNAYAQDPKFRINFLDKKLSPANARNFGFQQSSGDLLCFIDSDTCLAEDWLKEILEACKRNCRAGGGSISLFKFQRKNVLALAQLYLQCNEFLNVGSQRQKLFVPSCNMFCHRTVFEKAGGFPNIRASEDTLFFLQIKDAKVHFIPSAQSYHIFRQDWKSFVENQCLLGKYVSIYRRRHYSSLLYKGIVPVLLSPVFLAIKFFRMCRRVAKAGSGHVRDFLRAFPFFCLGFLIWSYGFIAGFLERKNADLGNQLS